MRSRLRTSPLAVAAVLLTATAACGGTAADATSASAERRTTSTSTSTTEAPPTEAEAEGDDVAEDVVDDALPAATGREVDERFVRPDWLGTRDLPLRPDGLGEILPTPPELADRQLATPSELPPPEGSSFTSAISEVPDDVVARSTWQPACPVGLDELRYVTVSFWGFDGLHHTGELLVHRDAAEAMVQVFGQLHEARFPIEEMRVTRAEELDLHPTGDGNNTGAFVCRPSVGSTTWSEHASGLALDVNPFHNPLVRGDIVVPELASAYADRSDVRPGMIVEGDVVTAAFDAVGWGWGGHWSSSKDWMHFSRSGR